MRVSVEKLALPVVDSGGSNRKPGTERWRTVLGQKQGYRESAAYPKMAHVRC